MSRGDEALARITQMTKVTTDVVVGGAKSTKNVVFHSVQSEETSFVQQIVSACALSLLKGVSHYYLFRAKSVKERKVHQK